MVHDRGRVVKHRGPRNIENLSMKTKPGVDLDAVPQTPDVLFSKRVRTACVTAGIAAEPTPMADRVGLNRQTCHKYLNAETSIDALPAFYLFKVADALKCSVRWLYKGDGAPWNSIAVTNEENEVIRIMRAVSSNAVEHIVESARGQLAKEQAAPTTGRFSPAVPPPPTQFKQRR